METLCYQSLDDLDPHIALQSCDLPNNEDNDTCTGYLMGSGHGEVGNTTKEKEPVRPDQCHEDGDNQWNQDDCSAPTLLLMYSQTVLAIELVSLLPVIIQYNETNCQDNNRNPTPNDKKCQPSRPTAGDGSAVRHHG